MQLIPNWKQAHRMISVRVMALTTAVQTVWVTLPEEMKSAVPSKLIFAMTIALLLGGIVGRLVVQSNVQAPSEAPAPDVHLEPVDAHSPNAQ